MNKKQRNKNSEIKKEKQTACWPRNRCNPIYSNFLRVKLRPIVLFSCMLKSFTEIPKNMN